jgi:ectoine hydroxylase-related dioxygenase (phytanoyl-CoA dioxygenase family)
MADHIVATRPAADTSRSNSNVERATDKVRAASHSLKAFDGLVKISFADADESHIFVDCASGRVTTDDPGAPPRVAITLNSPDLVRLADRTLDPRTMFGFKRTFKVEGSIPDAMHFLDALQGAKRSQPEFDPELLPKATDDLARAKADYEQFGYCLLKDAIAPEQVASLRQRLVEQAAGEREAGVATRDGGAHAPNQRVWYLPNKGQEFIDLLDNPVIDAFCPEVLGDHYILASYSANIAGKDGDPMYLHYDQVFADPPIPELMMGLNYAFFLDDVSEANGGTRLMPGSTRDGYAPDNPLTIDGTIAAEGPAGTALIWDSRIWHGTGTNRTDKPRHVLLLFFVRFFIRPQDNYGLFLRDDVKATLSERVQTFLGFRVTNSLGGLGLGKEGTIVSRPVEPIGQLSSN